MIQKPRRTRDRRILSFPAVHPCEGISPSTLLSSLLSLSDEIRRFGSHSFVTQRRNAGEALRTASLLRIFFEEAIGAGLSDTAVLCLSELHLALQRLRFLLEDLSHDGARIWLLAKSEFAASQFTVFARSVATAIDVMPLKSAGLEAEVVELVELIGEQCWKAKFKLDREDEKFTDQVFAIISQLERKVEPRFRSVKRVLEYLGIKTWIDCNDEVRFLEDELEFEASDCDEREIPLLSSLSGLMTYSRAVIFEESDWSRSRELYPDSLRRRGTTVTEALRCLNPSEFRCPISLEIMTDPVTVSTGQTYDRASIQKWLKSGNTKCPKTGEKLTSTELVQNSSLRRLIHSFCEENGAIITPKPTRKTQTQIHSRGASSLLASLLVRRLVFGSNQAKNKAALEIRLATKSSSILRSILIDSGAVAPLINLLSAAAGKGDEENAAAALLRLSKDATGQILIVESGGLGPILSLLHHGRSPESKQIAAACAFYLTASSPETARLIGEHHRRTIPALAELLRSGTPCGKKNAAVAIHALITHHPANATAVLLAGAVSPLVNALTFPYKAEVSNDSLAVLSSLAETREGAEAVAAEEASVAKIKAVLKGSNSRASKEYCVSVLLSLCENKEGDEVTAVLASDQTVMSLLYSVITDGTSIASKKARCLIKILHKFREATMTSSSSSRVGFSREQAFVRAW